MTETPHVGGTASRTDRTYIAVLAAWAVVGAALLIFIAAATSRDMGAPTGTYVGGFFVIGAIWEGARSRPRS